MAIKKNRVSINKKAFFEINRQANRNIGGMVNRGARQILNSTKKTTSALGKKILERGKVIVERRSLESREYNELHHIQILEADKRKKQIDEIHKKMMREMGITQTRLGRDRRFFAIANALHAIYGEKISMAQIKQANRVLRMELSSNSRLLQQSPVLANEILRMKYGKITPQGQQIINHAVQNILESNQLI
ncbi:MAG: hypothetical protein PHX27_03425 [Candidatus ainarchaeum sp.]|nr:hypothetical protein [Candidatus ainarchaeum sp.]